MPRIAGAVVEGVPYHVTQRGNGREDTFFDDEDRQKYLEWLLEYSNLNALNNEVSLREFHTARRYA